MQDFKQYKQGLIEIDKIKPYERNAKIHNSLQLEQIKKSILEFGFTNPLIVDSDFNLIAGHGRLEALKMINRVEFKGKPIKEVNAVIIDGLSETQKRALIIADNKIAENAIWDEELLKSELVELDDLGFDLDLLGFDNSDLNIIIEEIEQENNARVKTGNSFEYGDGNNSSGMLFKKFIVPPFSVLDTKAGYWQDRKNKWLEITGDLTQTKEAVLGESELINSINGGSSNFDPLLAEIVIKWFNTENGKILDPFGGEQTKGVVAGELGVEYHAVEIRQEQVDLNKEKTKKYKKVHYYCGDSNNISTIIKERNFDLCFTSPPYYDLEVYSKDDLSSLGSYDEFLRQYKNIFKQCFEMLAENRFLVIKIGEIRDKKSGEYRNFLGDNIRIFKELGFKYYNEFVLLTSIGTAQIRCGKIFNSSRKNAKVHQNVLVFYKGDLKEIKNHFVPLEFDEGADFEN